MIETCRTCGFPIRVSIFKGAHYCSENCRKLAAGEPIGP